jgi:hypothetical protein
MIPLFPNPPSKARESGAKRGAGLPTSRASARTLEWRDGAPHEKGRGGQVPRFDDKAHKSGGGYGF